MRITFLGTGDAGGVPLPGCPCRACRRAREVTVFRRGPSSALVEIGDTRILLDAGLPDLAERFPPGSLSAIVLTHFGIDHIEGLFRLRHGCGERLPIFCPPDTASGADLHSSPGRLWFRRPASFEPFQIGQLALTPIPLDDTRPTFGYVVEDASGASFAYLTRTAGLSQKSETRLRDCEPDAVLIDCTRPPRSDPEDDRDDLSRALAVVRALRHRQTLLTHVGHGMDEWLLDHPSSLPPGVALARDEHSIVLRTTGYYHDVRAAAVGATGQSRRSERSVSA